MDRRDARRTAVFAHHRTGRRQQGVRAGTLYIRRSFDFKFAGTFDGSRLTFGTETKVELLVEGTNMRGTSDGPTAARTVTLSKHK